MIKDTPKEVINVYAIMRVNIPIGLKLLIYCEDIIAKYPEYFK